METSKGRIDLTEEEHGLLRKLLSGTANLPEGQRLYQCTVARGQPFPPEWEVHVLRLALAELPERLDLSQRLAVVEATLADRSKTGPETPERSAWESAWTRFASTVLVVNGEQMASAAARASCVADAVTLLSSPHFDSLGVDQRTATILALHDTLMSAPSSDLVLVADLGLRQFRLMLDDPALTDAQAMGVYDALHSLYFAGVTDVLELCRFDAIVPPFEDWLYKRRAPDKAASPPRSDGALSIAYLLHTGHFDRGNAVSPLIVSLADMHAAVPGRRVFLYLVSYVGPNFPAEISGRAFTVRSFPQGRSYDRIDEIAAALREDHIDVVVTEQNRAIAAALFTRRVAPLQIWADTGFPFWNLRSLDWTFSPAWTGAPDVEKRVSALPWRQSAATLRRDVDPSEVARIRGGFPREAFVLGVFVRLVKLNDRFFDLLGALLAAEPSFRLVITGTGDPQTVRDFMARSGYASRITLLNENVDLNVYGQVVDVMCDTFPFIGGYACREVSAQGTPVVSMLGNPWDDLLREERSPELLARDQADYVNLVSRLFRDLDFRERQRKIVLEKFVQQTDPKRMIIDVEAGIAAALTAADKITRSPAEPDLKQNPTHCN